MPVVSKLRCSPSPHLIRSFRAELVSSTTSTRCSGRKRVMLRPSSGQRYSVVDPGSLRWPSRRGGVSTSDAPLGEVADVGCGNRAVDAVPHERGAPSRGLPEPMFLHLAPDAASTFQKRVTGCLGKCFLAAVPFVWRLGHAVQYRAGEGTVRGPASQRFEVSDRRFAEEVTLAISDDVAKVSDEAFGNFGTPVALECTGQGLGCLPVVAGGVGGALREPLPVARMFRLLSGPSLTSGVLGCQRF